MKKGLSDLINKLRRIKKKGPEEIPPGHIKCTRCGIIIKEEKAILSLPEELWVCDKCYFRQAE